MMFLVRPASMLPPMVAALLVLLLTLLQPFPSHAATGLTRQQQLSKLLLRLRNCRPVLRENDRPTGCGPLI